jgi:hypothetical protein
MKVSTGNLRFTTINAFGVPVGIVNGDPATGEIVVGVCAAQRFSACAGSDTEKQILLSSWYSPI